MSRRVALRHYPRMHRDPKLKRAVALATDLIARKTQEAELATTFEAALEGITFGVPIRRELFTGHGEFYVVLLDGSCYVREGACMIHQNHCLMPLYTMKAAVDMYMTTWEPQVLSTRPSTRLDGHQVLELAADNSADVFAINWLGGGSAPEGKIRVDTLAHCRA